MRGSRGKPSADQHAEDCAGAQERSWDLTIIDTKREPASKRYAIDNREPAAFPPHGFGVDMVTALKTASPSLKLETQPAFFKLQLESLKLDVGTFFLATQMHKFGCPMDELVMCFADDRTQTKVKMRHRHSATS